MADPKKTTDKKTAHKKKTDKKSMGAVEKTFNLYTDAGSALLLGVAGWLTAGFVKTMLPDSPALADAINVGVGVALYAHSPDIMGKEHSKYAKRIAVGIGLRGAMNLLSDLTAPTPTAGLPNKGMLNADKGMLDVKKFVPPSETDFLDTKEMIDALNLPNLLPQNQQVPNLIPQNQQLPNANQENAFNNKRSNQMMGGRKGSL